MSTQLLLFIAFFTLAALVSTAPSDLIMMTPELLTQELAEGKTIVVCFYSRYYEYLLSSTKWVDEFEKAATKLKGILPVAAVDCTWPADCSAYSGLSILSPTITIFIGLTHKIEFIVTDGNDADDIVAYARDYTAGKQGLLKSIPVSSDTSQREIARGGERVLRLENELGQVKEDMEKLRQHIEEYKGNLVEVLNGIYKTHHKKQDIGVLFPAFNSLKPKNKD